MRQLSIEAEDWKSKVVNETEEMLSKKMPKLHIKLPKPERPWINIRDQIHQTNTCHEEKHKTKTTGTKSIENATF